MCEICKRYSCSKEQGKKSKKEGGKEMVVKEVEQVYHDSESDGSVNDKDSVSNSDTVGWYIALHINYKITQYQNAY